MDELEGFPRTGHHGQLYRQHRIRRGPDQGAWYFSGTQPGALSAGRFDLTTPRGTCYLAGSAAIAAREAVGRELISSRRVAEPTIHARVVTTVDVELDDLADTTSPDSARHGMTNEIGTVEDYDLSASWAARFDEAGMRGLLYNARFTPGPAPAFAVFGDAGAHPERCPPIVDSVPLSQVVLALGYTISGVPHAVPFSTDPVTLDHAPRHDPLG